MATLMVGISWHSVSPESVYRTESLSFKRDLCTMSSTCGWWKWDCTGPDARASFPVEILTGQASGMMGETGLFSSGGSAQDLARLAHKTSKTTFALLVGED